MVKIVQVNPTLATTAPGRIGAEIAEAGIERGMEGWLAYARRGITTGRYKAIKIGSRLDVIWHGIESYAFDRHGLASRRATRRFVKELERIGPDIVDLHNIHGYYLNYPILFDYLKRSGVKVVLTLHDCWTFTGHCSHYVTSNCEKWKSGCSDCPAVKKYPISYFGVDRSKKNFALKKKYFTSLDDLTVVTVSDWLREDAEQSFLNKYPIKRIYNAIDLETFHPYKESGVKEKYGIPEGKLLMGVANTWSSIKGLHHFLALREILPDDYTILLVGIDEKRKNTLPKGVVGITRTGNREELARLYSAAAVVLNLSSAESFGMTTIEGFACGTPSVVFNATASPELVTPETGIVVEYGDVAGVKRAVEEITANGREHYSQACRQRAEEHFNPAVNYNKYIDLYEEILRK